MVVAVIDSAINPYHLDFRPVPGLPAEQAPHEWLPGFPEPTSFASYTRLRPTLSSDPDEPVADLQKADAARWNQVRTSTRGAAHYTWIAGTKVIGLLDFAGNNGYGPLTGHGNNTAAVSVGREHGTCPECLLVFITYSGAAQGEAAIEWALSQPWIDVISNSYGFSAVQRDRLYSGSDTEAQRAASERGQTIFFSAGNGQNNDYLAPNTTWFSSQEGPDWIITVGGTASTGHNWTGTGKPADVAGPTTSYPSAGGTTVAGEGTFGGTSNATPVLAGLYARALGVARVQLAGPSRGQAGGVVATGAPIACGTARPACELGDGELTAAELRTRFLHAAVRTPEGLRTGGSVQVNAPVSPEEGELMAEGHGTFWGRLRDDYTWDEETARILGPLDGTAAALARPAGEREWFVVDSWCRQQLWGEWTGGAWRAGEPLPAPDSAWPVRTALAASCDRLFPPL